MIVIEVPGKAQTSGSKRAFVRGGRAQVVDANPNAGAWKERVAIAAGQAMKGVKLIDGAVSLEVVVEFARPGSHLNSRGEVRGRAPRFPLGRDLTKLVRGIEDGLNGVVWRDDRQVVQQRNVKRYGTRDVTTIVVREIAITE